MRGRRGRHSEALKPVEAFLKQVMPPQYSDRLKLDRLAGSWAEVVGPQLARQSAPFDIANGELIVVAETPLVGNRLSMIGGNIVRLLKEKWHFDLVRVKVVTGARPVRAIAPNRTTRPPEKISVREEDVEDLRRRYEEVLPEDAAESFARFRLFFERRFGKK